MKSLNCKKGSMYFISIVLLISLLFYFITSSSSNRTVTQSYITAIELTKDFVEDFERDLKRVVYIISFRALLSIEERIVKYGTFSSDLNKEFKEAFYNGTIYNENMSNMINNSFRVWLLKLNETLSKQRLSLQINHTDVTIYQNSLTGPWFVGVNFTLNYTLLDLKTNARISRGILIQSLISIIEFEDPVFLINTLGRYSRTIRKSPYYNHFVVEGNTTNLLNHTYHGYYIHTNSSPSFLMRLQGNLSKSKYGIESLVDINALLEQGLEIKNKSIVDYIYFSEENPKSYRINNTPFWFRLDNTSSHLKIYQVENITIS